MRKHRWQIILAVSLVVVSASLYSLHYYLFHDAHHIFVYLVGDIAFVPIEVLLVTMIIDRLLAVKERRSMLNKMNMVVSIFFSQAGNSMLSLFSRFDTDPGETRAILQVKPRWKETDFATAVKTIKGYEFRMDSTKGDLMALRDFMLSQRDLVLRLLENPVLLDHEIFTDLLWAISHLTDELSARDVLDGLPNHDYAHLSGDLERAYGLLIKEWLIYMKHLKDEYPYLYSLAVRVNPFDTEATAIIPDPGGKGGGATDGPRTLYTNGKLTVEDSDDIRGN